jgi:hypothetical protein
MVDIGSILGLAIEDVAKIDGYEIATGAKCMGLDITLELQGDVGLIGGGSTDGTIDYITITSTGNAKSFGELSVAVPAGAFASSTRGVFGGGHAKNNIEYVTIVTKGNGTDFGDTTTAGRVLSYACSNSTRGIWFGGNLGSPDTPYNVMDYVTIASTGNATDFGDLSTWRVNTCAVPSTTRAICIAGYYGAYVNVMEYVTISTTGNTTDFGDVSRGNAHYASCTSGTRGVFAGSAAPIVNYINYITIATPSNSTNFGDATVETYSRGGTDNGTRGIFSGTHSAGNVIDYVTIASTGNATDFGDLVSGRNDSDACSNCHGALS